MRTDRNFTMPLEVDSRMLVSGKDYYNSCLNFGRNQSSEGYNYIYLIASTAKYNCFFKKHFIEV